MDARGSGPADRSPSQNRAQRRQAKYEHENGHSNYSNWQQTRSVALATRSHPQHRSTTRDDYLTNAVSLLRGQRSEALRLSLAQDLLELNLALCDQLALQQVEQPTSDPLRQLRPPKRDSCPTSRESLPPIPAYGMAFEGKRQPNR
jgi:hypothetical protein